MKTTTHAIHPKTLVRIVGRYVSEMPENSVEHKGISSIAANLAALSSLDEKSELAQTVLEELCRYKFPAKPTQQKIAEQIKLFIHAYETELLGYFPKIFKDEASSIRNKMAKFSNIDTEIIEAIERHLAVALNEKSPLELRDQAIINARHNLEEAEEQQQRRLRKEQIEIDNLKKNIALLQDQCREIKKKINDDIGSCEIIRTELLGELDNVDRDLIEHHDHLAKAKELGCITDDQSASLGIIFDTVTHRKELIIETVNLQPLEYKEENNSLETLDEKESALHQQQKSLQENYQITAQKTSTIKEKFSEIRQAIQRVKERIKGQGKILFNLIKKAIARINEERDEYQNSNSLLHNKPFSERIANELQKVIELIPKKATLQPFCEELKDIKTSILSDTGKGIDFNTFKRHISGILYLLPIYSSSLGNNCNAIRTTLCAINKNVEEAVEKEVEANHAATTNAMHSLSIFITKEPTRETVPPLSPSL